MQTYAFKDPLSLGLRTNYLLKSPLVLISTCFILPNEIKQIASGPTTTLTFVVILIQEQCISVIYSTVCLQETI